MTERSIARAGAGVKAGKERVDDNLATIAKRVKGFREKNRPVETHVAQHGPFKIVSNIHKGPRMSLMIQKIPCGSSRDEVWSAFQPVVLEMINGKA